MIWTNACCNWEYKLNIWIHYWRTKAGDCCCLRQENFEIYFVFFPGTQHKTQDIRMKSKTVVVWCFQTYLCDAILLWCVIWYLSFAWHRGQNKDKIEKLVLWPFHAADADHRLLLPIDHWPTQECWSTLSVGKRRMICRKRIIIIINDDDDDVV